jgi:hypothetical protein
LYANPNTKCDHNADVATGQEIKAGTIFKYVDTYGVNCGFQQIWVENPQLGRIYIDAAPKVCPLLACSTVRVIELGKGTEKPIVIVNTPPTRATSAPPTNPPTTEEPTEEPETDEPEIDEPDDVEPTEAPTLPTKTHSTSENVRIDRKLAHSNWSSLFVALLVGIGVTFVIGFFFVLPRLYSHFKGPVYARVNNVDDDDDDSVMLQDVKDD